MTREDLRDRLIDALLEEVLGGETPPDLLEKILRRASRRRRAWAGLSVGIAAAVLLAIGGWIVFESASRSQRTPVEVPAAPIISSPLPSGAQGFQGFLSGKILSVDATSLVLQVARAAPGPGNKSLEPRWLEGRKARLLIVRYRDEVSRPLLQQAETLNGREATADVWAERDEALIVTRLRPGVHAD